ncbi:MAG: hypothetical protein GWN58_63440 [Anaerolineae bacterium]|nr:hypothetical protein [Anaerolineae bacterium]
MIGLPLTSDQIMSRLRNGHGDAVVEQIEKGVELAKQLGCTQIGFAGYTSIATNNCLALVENTIGLTSGNSLTAAAAIEATHLAAHEMGINLEAARLGIVGGVGNIGRVLAEIEADVVGSILLAGRPGTQRRLERLAEAIYARAWQQVMQGETGQGIARAIANTNVMAHLKPGENPEAVGAVIRQALADELGPSAPIQITTDLADLRQCELIISATNSPTPIIGPDHVGPGPTVICDVSVPTDVQPSLRAQCPQVRVIKGGIMQLPLGQDLSIGGMALPDGQYYACLTEVILLGLAGIREHFSYGLLQAERVRQISQLARQHRFSVIVRET